MKLCISSIAFILLISTCPATAATRDAEPGTDLGAMARTLASGDVIRLKPGRYQGGALAERKRLIIQGPTNGEAIIEPGRSNFVLGAVEGGTLEMSNVSIETSTTAYIGLYAKGSTIRCSACQLRGKAGRAVYAEAGVLDLVGGSITVPGGEGLIALNGSTLRLKGVAISSANGMPVAVEKSSRVEIEDSSFVGKDGALIRTVKEPISVARSSFRASGADGVGLELGGGGAIVLEKVEAQGGRLGLVAQLQPGATLKLSGVTTVGTRGGIHLEQKENGQPSQVTIEEGSSIATASTNDAIALRSVGQIEVRANGHLATSAGPAGIMTSANAIIRLQGGLAAGSRQGVGSAGDKPGEIRVAESVLVPATAGAIPGATLDSNSARINAALIRDKELASEVQAGVTNAIKAGSASGLAAIAAKTRARAADYSTVSLEVVDAVGQAVSRPFVVLDLNGKKVAESVDGGAVAVEAGAYLVEEIGDGALSADIDLGKGESLKAKAQVPDALWLNGTLEKNKPAQLVLFRPAEEAVVRNVFAGAGGGYSFVARIWPRAEATAEEIQRALEGARKLAVMRLVFPSAGSAAEKDRYNVWDQAMTDWALPVLASFGHAGDAALIIRSFERPNLPEQNRGPILNHLAYLEWRLGILAKGEVARLAQGGSLAANALVLQSFYNIPGASDRLIALMQDGVRFGQLSPSLRDQVASQIAARDFRRFGSVASETLQRVVGRALNPGAEMLREVSAPAAAYLLLFGTTQEKRVIAEEMSKPSIERTDILAWLTRLAANPAEIGGEIIRNPYVGSEMISNACSFLRLRKEAAFDDAFNRIIVAFANNAVALNEKNYRAHPSVIYNSSVLTRHLLLGGCRPDKDVGKVFYRDMVDVGRQGSPGNWYPAFQAADQVVAFMEKTTYFTDELKSIAPALVLAAWQRATPAAWSEFRDERMALIKAFSKSGDIRANASVDDGVERRVFVMRHAGAATPYSGAVAGHVEVVPRSIDGKIAIELRLNHRPYYWGIEEDGLATTIATGGDLNRWAHHSFVVAGGRKLIERIVLAKSGRPIDFVEQPADGTFRLITSVPASDWAELTLTVDLALLDDRRSFGFDLFASGLARGKAAATQ